MQAAIRRQRKPRTHRGSDHRRGLAAGGSRSLIRRPPPARAVHHNGKAQGPHEHVQNHADAEGHLHDVHGVEEHLGRHPDFLVHDWRDLDAVEIVAGGREVPVGLEENLQLRRGEAKAPGRP